MADSLVARLREAIDETERIAQAAKRRAPRPWMGTFKQVTEGPIGEMTIVASTDWAEVSHHIDANDPDRVLRRCAADRKILDPHVPMQWAFKWVGPTDDRQRVPDMRCSVCWTDYDPDGKFDHECHHGPHEWPCAMVLALSEAYGVEA